jgi:hypothetical protein
VSSRSEPTVFMDIPTCIHKCRSRLPRDLICRSAAARLLGLRVRIPPEARMSLVNVVYCQVEVPATSLSLDQRSPTGCGITESDVETSTMWRHRSVYDCCATRNTMHPLHSFLWLCVPFQKRNIPFRMYILIRLVPCGHINVQKPNNLMRIY